MARAAPRRVHPVGVRDDRAGRRQQRRHQHQALDGALALAATIAANGPLAVEVTRQIARGSRDWSLEEGWTHQDELMAPVFMSEDAMEGAQAFAEKRPPVWRGR